MFLQKKEQIRQNILSIRNNLSKSIRSDMEKSLANRFNQFILPLFKDKKAIAAYYPFGTEIDILSILANISTKLLLPVIDSPGKPLKFYSWLPGDELCSSKYAKNILEPFDKKGEKLPDVVIAPLIACDLLGNRIGSGRAMYDITISSLRRQNPKLIFIGICYDFQLIDPLPTEVHDQKLDIILTELRIATPNPSL